MEEEMWGNTAAPLAFHLDIEHVIAASPSSPLAAGPEAKLVPSSLKNVWQPTDFVNGLSEVQRNFTVYGIPYKLSPLNCSTEINKRQRGKILRGTDKGEKMYVFRGDSK